MTAFPDTLKHGSGASLTREPDRLLVSLASGATIAGPVTDALAKAGLQRATVAKLGSGSAPSSGQAVHPRRTMIRSRKRKSPSPGYRRRTPLVLRWFIGLAGATALLVALAYLIGSRADKPRNEGERILDGASSPGIALVITFGALVFAAWCLRQMLLHRLAWRPGRIEVARFTAGSKLTDTDPDDLTISFRRQLATLRLRRQRGTGGGPRGRLPRRPERRNDRLAQHPRDVAERAARGRARPRIRGSGRVARARGAAPVQHHHPNRRAAVGEHPADQGPRRFLACRHQRGGRRGDGHDPPAHTPLPRPLGHLAWPCHAARTAARLRGGDAARTGPTLRRGPPRLLQGGRARPR